MTRDEEVRYAFAKLYQTTEDALNALMAKVDARARAEEREACCSIVHGQCESDNVAQRTVDAIRARGEKK